MKKSTQNWLLVNRFFLIGIFFFLHFFNSSAQQNQYFSKTYNLSSDNIDLFTSGIQVNNDTIVYIQGAEVRIDNSIPFFITAINLNTSDTLWVKKYGSIIEKHYRGLSNTMVLLDNYLYCGGFYADTSNLSYPFLFKLKLNGDTVWRKIYKNYSGTYSGFNSVILTKDNLIIASGVKQINGSNTDMLIVKIDTTGTIIFDKLIGQSNREESNNIDTISDGGYIIGGFREVSGPILQGYIVRVDSLGNSIWDTVLSNQLGVFVKTLSNGQILAFLSKKTPSLSIAEGYAIILDSSNGNIIQENTYEFSTTFYTQLLGVVEFNNNLFFAGWALKEDIGIPAGIWLKTTLNLDSLSSRWYISRLNDNYFNNLYITSKDEFLMLGFVFPDSIINTQDSWLVHSNCIGALEPPLAIATLNFSEINYTEQIILNNSSTEFESSITDWGDFSSDTIFSSNDSLQNHQYTLPGQYNVTVTTIACKDTSVWQTTLTILPKDYDSGLTVFPNPTSSNLNIWVNSQKAFVLYVYDATGRLLIQENIIENTINSGYSVNMSSLSNGVYLINLSSDSENLQVKVVKSE